ncbi:GGDEF domain-containing protein [Pseudonocardia sp.]|uniref:GGDEF domain-containing protein n=1 Tax=Pseudonocardia sp. TaxID=60912 RepID=UPI00263744C2|nr:GGDEF domain-containing protein [Pseudonocardia sp.]
MPALPPLLRLRSWPVWMLPARLVGLLLGIEVLAALVLARGLVLAGPGVDATQFWTLGALTLAGIAHTEASLGVERARHRVDDEPHIDLSSVWTFAAALLLPAWLATGAVLLIYLHLHVRAWRAVGTPLHRVVFSTATVVLAVHAVTWVRDGAAVGDQFGSIAGLLVVLAAIVAYALVNLLLVAVALRLNLPGASFGQVVGHRDELVLEIATLAMGAVVAGVVAVLGPAYAILVLPPLVVLHRTVLVRQLEEEASIDGKTGLLNAGAWRLQAGLAVRAARRDDGSVAVLLLDLDHFKIVNDNHGHLAGDQVLSAIGAALRAEVRDQDLVGRFGGEEFVVLLVGDPGADPVTSAVAVADRIRRRIDGLRPVVASQRGSVVLDGVSVSVGVAAFPRDGTDLDRLLEVADGALYAAKEAGRNSVRYGGRPGLDPV